jgi:hypothetical protein
MQTATRVGGQADDVAGVGGYFGLNQNDVKHAASLSEPALWLAAWGFDLGWCAGQHHHINF